MIIEIKYKKGDKVITFNNKGIVQLIITNITIDDALNVRYSCTDPNCTRYIPGTSNVIKSEKEIFTNIDDCMTYLMNNINL